MRKARAKKPGKLKPGIHSMSYELYAAADGVSKSMLDILADQTPAHLQAYIAEQKANAEKADGAKRFGVILHRALLEPDSYRDGFHVKPEHMTFTTIEGKAWKSGHLDRPIITTSEEQAITAMVSAVHTHPYAKALLIGRMEANLFALDNDGVMRKCRLDCLSAGNIVPDIKTCESASLRSFEKSISNYRYHVQAPYYMDLCKLAGYPKDYFVFIAVEKSPPYAVRCLRLLPEVIEAGRAAYQRDLQLYKNCLKSGIWQAWEESYVDCGLPEWEMKQIARVMR